MTQTLPRQMRRRLVKEGMDARVKEHEERLDRIDQAIRELVALLLQSGVIGVKDGVPVPVQKPKSEMPGLWMPT